MAKRPKQYFSISQISCFRGCKQEWAYKYREGLKSKAPQRPLYMGTTLHKLLEIRANGQSWESHLCNVIKPEFEAMPTDYQAILGEDFIDCCYKIMTQYDWLYDKEDIKYLATEVKIDAKIKGSKRFVGVVDAIVEIDGDQYIMEHKTFKTTKMSLDQTWLNAQTCLYIKVLNESGWNIKGVVWDMIKTSAPKPPRILKNGQFGKQYADQTLMSFEWAGVYMPGLPKDVYEEIKDNHKNFLDRYITPILPSVVDAVWKDFVDSVEDISKNKHTPKNLGRDCEWCAFKELCQAELTGGDVEYIKQLYYTTAEQRDKELFEEFKKTEECYSCQMMVEGYGAEIDFEQCRLCCEKYKNYKEENKK